MNSSSMDQMNKCCICQERLRGSVASLPCFHSACLTCLTNLTSYKPPYKCPVCRTNFEVPEKGISFLPRNEFSLAPYISDAVAKVTKEGFDINNIICEICDGEEAKIADVLCVDCDQFYCEECQRSHRKQKGTLTHTFLTVDEALAPALDTNNLSQSASGDLGGRVNKCLIHPQQILSVYCKECQLCICSDCAVDEHVGHGVDKIKAMVDVARQELSTLLQTVEETEKTFASSVLSVSQVIEGVRQSNLAADKDIAELAKLLYLEIDKRKQELVTEAKEVAKFKEKELKNQRDDLEFVLGGLRHISTYAKAVSSGTDAEIVTARDLVEMRKSTLLGIPVNLEPEHDSTVLFHHDNGYKITQAIHSVGRIITSQDDAVTVSRFVRDYDTVNLSLLQIGSPGWKEKFFNGVAAVAVNSRGDILTAEYNTHRVQVFNAEGIFSFKFGTLGKRNSEFDCPYGICVDLRDNRIIVADGGNHRLQVFNDRGTHLLNIGSIGHLPGQLLNPRGVCVDRTGNIFVADMGNHRIQVFDSEGNFFRRFGTCGTELGKLFNPIGVGVLLNNKIVVSECSNDRVQIFSSKGVPIRVVGVGLLLRPWHLFVDSMDNILVADCNNNRIQVFSQYGGLQASLGAGKLSGPTGICMDQGGRVVVSEIVAQRVTIL